MNVDGNWMGSEEQKVGCSSDWMETMEGGCLLVWLETYDGGWMSVDL